MKKVILAACTFVVFGIGAKVSAQHPAAADAADGKAVFDASCKGCHGVNGTPTAAMVKMMNVPRLDAAYFAKHKDAEIVEVLKKGQGKMKSFTGKLTPDQMLAVSHYLRGLAAPSS
jgi:cytochrome c6